MMQLTSEVPQGSVLGSTPWNILYKGLLRLSLPRGTEFIAFDVGSTNQLESAAEKATNWMATKGLRLAAHKTEMIVISNNDSLPTNAVITRSASRSGTSTLLE